MCRVPLCKQDARAGGNQIQTMNIFGDYNPSHPDWASLMLRGLCSESKPLESDLRSIVARRIAGAFRAQLEGTIAVARAERNANIAELHTEMEAIRAEKDTAELELFYLQAQIITCGNCGKGPTSVSQETLTGDTVETYAFPDEAQKDVSGDASGDEAEARHPTAIVEGVLEDEAGASLDEVQQDSSNDKAGDEAETGGPTAVVEGALEVQPVEADASPGEAQQNDSDDKTGDKAGMRGPTAVSQETLTGGTVETNAFPDEAQKDVSGDASDDEAEARHPTTIVEGVLEDEAGASLGEVQQDTSSDKAGDETETGEPTAVVEGALEVKPVEADASPDGAQQDDSDDKVNSKAEMRGPTAVSQETLDGGTVETNAFPDEAQKDVSGDASGNEAENIQSRDGASVPESANVESSS
ncbi:unnamed protein product, partial [Ascophyllum nodosum]